MPSAGISLLDGTDRLAVGSPSVRPRPSPRTTVPRSAYHRPSSLLASVTRPARKASRIRVLLTGAPSSSTGSAIRTWNPYLPPSRRNTAATPLRSRPKTSVAPHTTSAIAVVVTSYLIHVSAEVY